MIDPINNLLLSPSEGNNYEIANVANSPPSLTPLTSFFENPGIASGGELDSAGEDCATEIALAPAGFSFPSSVTATGPPEAARTHSLPPGACEGLNDLKRTGYGGPCPPIGRHRYFFKWYLWAVRCRTSGGPARAQLKKAMEGRRPRRRP